jgi:molecular chaperone DnaJ
VEFLALKYLLIILLIIALYRKPISLLSTIFVIISKKIMEIILENLSYYEILQIDQNADQTVIKKAYRRLAKEYHPDKNQGDAEAETKFKYINEAYQTLSDDQQRAIYDRYGKEGLQGGGGRRSSGMGGFEDLGSIFEEMFGGGFGGGRQRGSRADMDKYPLDMNVDLSISFNEAVFGCEKEINYKYRSSCSSCKGTGAKDGKLSPCNQCQGKGQVYVRQGFMTFSQTCPACQGEGSKPSEKCGDCHGQGYTEQKDSVKINVPKGIDNGNRLRVSGRGNIGKNGRRGDLYVTFSVKADKHFVRSDNDVYIEIPVFFTQAITGDEITIPSLTGELKLQLDVGTRDKQHFKFRGEGIEDVHGHGKGDLIAQVNITYPKKINDIQKDLLFKLQESFGIESKPHEGVLDSAIEKMKKWFK